MRSLQKALWTTNPTSSRIGKKQFMSKKKETKRQSNFFDVCTKCKTSFSCCNDTTPPITLERGKIVEAYLTRKGFFIENPFAETEYVFPRIDSDKYCVFHDKQTRKCLIHDVKPETCVAGPITFDINKKTGKIEWHIKMEKICPLVGIVYENKKLLRDHLKSAKKEILRLVSGLDKKALQEILKKEEPETFKIGEDNIEMDVLNKLG